jgi:hypothetical protein
MSDKELFVENVLLERGRQDMLWGGPEHDDTHNESDWIAYICREAGKASRDSISLFEFEKQMIQVAALAMSAFESSRRYGTKK